MCWEGEEDLLGYLARENDPGGVPEGREDNRG